MRKVSLFLAILFICGSAHAVELVNGVIDNGAEAKPTGILATGKAFVNEVKPNVGLAYDFFEHEMVQFYSRNIYEKGNIAIPVGYTSSDAITAAVSYKVGPIAPFVGASLRDIEDIANSPTTFSKGNIGLLAGANYQLKF